MDELLGAHYAYRFGLGEHPAPAPPPGSAGQGLPAPESWLGQDGGFYRPPVFYRYAGSPLWARMVAAGRLAGPDAVPPEDRDLAEVLLTAATLA
jgi:hypothetical protein